MENTTSGTTKARIAGMVKHSSVDGPGVRFTVFFQGCPHHCPGCHNPETWDPAGGEEISLDELIEEIRNAIWTASPSPAVTPFCSPGQSLRRLTRHMPKGLPSGVIPAGLLRRS